MRFTLYTEKTVADCARALTERMQAPRSPLDGWVEKKGRFSLTVEGRVIGPFKRRTRMDGEIVREGGETVIRGQVAEGAPPAGQLLILFGLLGGAVLLLLLDQIALAMTCAAGGLIGYAFARGDWENSDRLLAELERTLKASPKPAKKPPVKK
jgi:hypothetical protein